MYCNSCGKAIPDDARFCSHCATVVGSHPSARKKLMRSRSDRKIAGVCAGLAEHLDLDATLVRLLWLFVAIMSGIFPGLVVYLLAWIVMPEEPAAAPAVATGQVVTSQ
jgi:phage shock protein C